MEQSHSHVVTGERIYTAHIHSDCLKPLLLTYLNHKIPPVFPLPFWNTATVTTLILLIRDVVAEVTKSIARLDFAQGACLSSMIGVSRNLDCEGFLEMHTGKSLEKPLSGCLSIEFAGVRYLYMGRSCLLIGMVPVWSP